jgi:hypothetical protein
MMNLFDQDDWHGLNWWQIFNPNSHGYDIAKLFSNKFSMVSPVWLQVKRRPGGSYHVQGGHDIDDGIEFQNECKINVILAE